MDQELTRKLGQLNRVGVRLRVTRNPQHCEILNQRPATHHKRTPLHNLLVERVAHNPDNVVTAASERFSVFL